MTGGTASHSGVLKWYPRTWRDRYGDELVSLLDDTYGDQQVPLRTRLSMMKAGSTERLRWVGFVGDSVEPDRRVRGASLVVLCAWALFVVAGSGFAKYAEHWDRVTPLHDRAVPSDAFTAVQVAAFTGVVIFCVSTLVALPAFVRFIRGHGWAPIRRPLSVMLITSSIAMVATVGIVVWSHHFGSSPLNSGLWPYKAAGITWGILVVSAIAAGAGAIVAVVSRLEPSPRTSRALGILALLMAIVLVVVFAGMLTWWISLAIHAPWFFGSGIVGTAGSQAPPAMIVFGALMAVGLVLGTCGASRVVLNLGEFSPSEHG